MEIIIMMIVVVIVSIALLVLTKMDRYLQEQLIDYKVEQEAKMNSMNNRITENNHKVRDCEFHIGNIQRRRDPSAINTDARLEQLERFHKQLQENYYVKNIFHDSFPDEPEYLLKNEAVSFKKVHISGNAANSCPEVKTMYCTPAGYEYKKELIKYWKAQVKKF